MRSTLIWKKIPIGPAMTAVLSCALCSVTSLAQFFFCGLQNTFILCYRDKEGYGVWSPVLRQKGCSSIHTVKWVTIVHNRVGSVLLAQSPGEKYWRKKKLMQPPHCRNGKLHITFFVFRFRYTLIPSINANLLHLEAQFYLISIKKAFKHQRRFPVFGITQDKNPTFLVALFSFFFSKEPVYTITVSIHKLPLKLYLAF